MTAQEIRQAMENKLEYLMEVKPQLATDDQLYKAAALVLRDIMVEKRRAHRQMRAVLAHHITENGIRRRKAAVCDHAANIGRKPEAR